MMFVSGVRGALEPSERWGTGAPACDLDLSHIKRQPRATHHEASIF